MSKKVLIILVCATVVVLTLSKPVAAEDPYQVAWTQQLGTSSEDGGRGVSVDSSGNAYVTGYTGGDLDGNTSAGSRDMFLTKYDTDGTKQWTQQLGTSNEDGGYGVSVDSSGNAYVTGYTDGGLDGNTSAGDQDMFLTKYDTDGTKLWTQQLGTSGGDYGFGVSVDSSGNAYVTGRTEGDLDGNTSAGGDDMFLIKFAAPEPPFLLEGDANRDGVVSASDYSTVQGMFGQVGEPGMIGDANGDGVVSAGDYASVQANFGNTAAAQVTPEPATLSLLALAGLAMLRRRRK